MKLKVLLLTVAVVPVVLVIFYIIVGTATKAFEICEQTEFFVGNNDLVNEEEMLARMQKARMTQNLKIGEIGGKQNVDDPVSDAYLPYSFNVYDKKLPSASEMQEHNNYEYTITATHKTVLERNPNEEELMKYLELFKKGEMDENLLRTYLYNSSEYAMKSRVQSNDVNNDLEYAYAKEDIFAMIAMMYFAELEEEVPKSMLLPLRDMFMYFDNDQYMFRAFLLDDNYKKFEQQVIGAKRLKKENILDVYRKYMKEDEIKLTANDIRKYDILTKSNQNNGDPKMLPVNSSFQGADLSIINEGIGAGSGAQAVTDVKPLTVDDLINRVK